VSEFRVVTTSFFLVFVALASGCLATTGVGGAIGSVTNSITGAVGAGTEVSGRSTNVSNYDGPRARLAVLRFTDATGGRASGYRWYSRNAGDAMARKLTSALLATKRFKIVDRKNMSDLMNEVNFGASGAVSAGSVAKFGKVVGARLIVTASITDFEDSGGSRGGSAGASKGLLGGLAGATKRTYMAINLQVIDVETSEIVASEQIDATVRDVSFGALFGGGSSSGGALAGVAGWDNEPKGKALQKVINSAVSFLENTVPQRYYTESSV